MVQIISYAIGTYQIMVSLEVNGTEMDQAIDKDDFEEWYFLHNVDATPGVWHDEWSFTPSIYYDCAALHQIHADLMEYLHQAEIDQLSPELLSALLDDVITRINLNKYAVQSSNDCVLECSGHAVERWSITDIDNPDSV